MLLKVATVRYFLYDSAEIFVLLYVDG